MLVSKLIQVGIKWFLFVSTPHCDYTTNNVYHYIDVIMGAMASPITSLMIVYSAVVWGADQRKHQSSASLAFVCGIHRWPVNSPHKRPVTRKMFPFDDVIMQISFAFRIPGAWCAFTVSCKFAKTTCITYLHMAEVRGLTWLILLSYLEFNRVS